MAKQETTKTRVPELVQLTVTEPKEFDDVISTATLTSSALEKSISELFGTTFSDFEGCKIVPQGSVMEGLKCKLYFKPCMNKNAEELYAVKSLGEINTNKVSTFSQMVNTVNMLSSLKSFELENIAKEILSEFLIIPNQEVTLVDRYNPELDKEVKVRLPKNWNKYAGEITDPISNTKYQNVYLEVTVDLVPVVAKLYGKKDLNEVKALQGKGIPRDRYQYQVNIVRVINATVKSYVLEVRRLDLKAIDKLSDSIGYGMVSGSLVMTRR